MRGERSSGRWAAVILLVLFAGILAAFIYGCGGSGLNGGASEGVVRMSWFQDSGHEYFVVTVAREGRLDSGVVHNPECKNPKCR